MYKKFIKMFVSKNISKFILIIFCITLSLTGFLISDNLSINIQKVITNDAKPTLGGDIKIDVVNKLNDIQTKYLEDLESRGEIVINEKIETSSTIEDKNGDPSLVSLLFTDDNFPLYGNLDIKGQKEGIFVTENVYDLFVEDSKIEIYGKIYNVGAVISSFPSSGLNFFDEGKKIILDVNDFELLGIEQLGARIDREYLIKVNDPNNFESILSDLKESDLFTETRIRDYKGGSERFQDIFAQFGDFIKYITIISFILTILIIFLSVESYYLSNKKDFSILRILGLKNNTLIGFNILLFFIVLLLSVIITTVLSQIVFFTIRTFEISSSFYIDGFSMFKTSLLGIIILLLSVLFPLFKFLSNNPLAGLKENFLQIYSKKEIFIELLLIFVGLIIIYTLTIGNFVSGIYFTLILFIGVLVISILIRYTLIFIYKLSTKLKIKDFSLYDSIRNTIKPGNLSTLITFSFIVSFCSLIFILIISLNFLDKLNIDLNNNDNIFIININENDLGKIDEKYKKSSYSMILGRVINVNDKTLKEHIGTSGRFSREFNITDNTLDDIKLLSGDQIKSGEVSIDNDFSKSIKIGIGDEVEFMIYGIKKTLTVTNIRESISGGIQPFFYFQVYKNDFKKFPKKYFLSTYIDPDNIKQFKSDFLKKTGNNISFIELDKILKEVKGITSKVFIVIQVLFIYVLVFCIITLIVSVLFLIPFKKKKLKLYNILGASSKFLNKNNFFEYVYLGSLSFIISLIIASSLSYFILDKSNFINFEIDNYLLSIFYSFLIFVLLIILINIFVKKYSKK